MLMRPGDPLINSARESVGGGAKALAGPEARGEQVGDTPVGLTVAIACPLCPHQPMCGEGLTDATTSFLLASDGDGESDTALGYEEVIGGWLGWHVELGANDTPSPFSQPERSREVGKELDIVVGPLIQYFGQKD